MDFPLNVTNYLSQELAILDNYQQLMTYRYFSKATKPVNNI